MDVTKVAYLAYRQLPDFLCRSLLPRQHIANGNMTVKLRKTRIRCHSGKVDYKVDS